uniref:Uncharacterized protein n=1 Tax=Arundo donax TaxID=35708 RepID=A0A0A9FH40_ARUDO
MLHLVIKRFLDLSSNRMQNKMVHGKANSHTSHYFVV